jgi:polysaccharide pyruvyl transferase WcaK-like protein
MSTLRRRAAEARSILGHADLVRPGTAFGYSGWAGEGNLGDDLMLLAHQQVLAPYRVALLPRTRIAERLGRLQRVPGGLRPGAILLGGGTLFGRADWWERMDPVRAAIPDAPWMAIGVGVEDEEFVAGRSFTSQDEMAKWAEFASGWPVLGVRGPRSRELLESYGLAAEVTGDPALLLAADAPAATPREQLLGVTVAVPEARWEDGGRGASALEDALVALRDLGWGFRFFVFSKWDDERTRGVCAQLGDRAEICRPASHRDLLRALGECHVVLGERLHSVVMAAAAATPSVAAEYRPKLRDFMRSIEREELAVRLDRTSAREVCDTVVRLADNRDAESAHLVRTVSDLNARLRTASQRAASVVAR